MDLKDSRCIIGHGWSNNHRVSPLYLPKSSMKPGFSPLVLPRFCSQSNSRCFPHQLLLQVSRRICLQRIQCITAFVGSGFRETRGDPVLAKGSRRLRQQSMTEAPVTRKEPTVADGSTEKTWRRVEDSNPCARLRANGFQDRRLRPLGQPSAGLTFEGCATLCL